MKKIIASSFSEILSIVHTPPRYTLNSPKYAILVAVVLELMLRGRD